jgi:hypothetical protein
VVAAGMNVIKKFFAFWYDFIVGDDWRIALGVVLAIAVTKLISDSFGAAWLVLPVTVALLLGWSLYRARRPVA